MLGKGPSAPSVQLNAHIGHHRDDQEDGQGQGKVDGGQDQEGDHCLYRRNEKFLRTVVGKFCYVKQVVGDPPHDLPHLRIIVIGVGQFLQVGVGISAHIRLDGGAHDMPHIRHIVVGHTVDDTQHQVQQRHLPDHFHSEPCQILYTGIGDKPDDHGEHQLAERGKGGAEQVRGKHALMLSVIGEKALHQLPGGIFFILCWHHFLRSKQQRK